MRVAAVIDEMQKVYGSESDGVVVSQLPHVAHPLFPSLNVTFARKRTK